MVDRRLTAIGITCGIGSMLVGARQAGFEVLGNIEWRKYYHAPDEHGRTTFRENFRDSVFKHNVDELTDDELARLMGADLALGHPECGNFSQLAGANKNRLKQLQDAGDLPLFVALVSKFKPQFFVMDDLPKSFGAYPMAEYAKVLVDYDLFPEWVSNWGYGNVQKHRNRMFMIGAMKSNRWVFHPGETDQSGRTLENAIGDLPEPRVGSNFPNHDPCAIDELSGRHLSMRFIGDRPTWREVAEYARGNWLPGRSVTYYANDGTIKHKPGSKVEYWGERGASVQCGASYKFHPVRFTPLTLRERARIQGFPDDFVFYGAKLNNAGEYNYDKNVHMTKQTGKAMPVQFCRYVSRQIAAHILGESHEASGRRLLPANAHVDDAKRWYCTNVGYADQERACGACWLYAGCSIRTRKYGIGISAPAAFGLPGTAAEAATGGGGTSNSFHPTGSGSEADVGQIGEAGQAAPALAPRRRRSNSVAEPASPAEEAATAGATGGSKGARPVTRVRRVGTAPARFADLPPDQEYDL